MDLTPIQTSLLAEISEIQEGSVIVHIHKGKIQRVEPKPSINAEDLIKKHSEKLLTAAAKFAKI